MTPPHPTPSQTVGPFYGHALPFPGGDDLAPGDPRALTLHGTVRDGSGAPVPDALLEFWQAAPDNSRTGATGSMRRDPVDGRVIGRDGTRFTGFGRVPTDADGHYALRTLPPPPEAPYLGVLVLARGLLHHLPHPRLPPRPPPRHPPRRPPPERRAT
ncbi:protocatechuate 3,4-dioxygenase alpha subunit, partial [Streptomyces sp. SolWspMP-sol7th]